MSDKNYDIVQYLKNHYNLHDTFTKDDIEDILIFAIFWNQIDNGVINNQYKIIKDYIDIKVINDNNEIKEISKYFHERYNNSTFNFDIILRNNPYNSETILHNKSKYHLLKTYNNLTFEEKKEFVSYIISRFRNRLFHGDKDIVKDQNENFIVINNFLHYLLTNSNTPQKPLT